MAFLSVSPNTIVVTTSINIRKCCDKLLESEDEEWDYELLPEHGNSEDWDSCPSHQWKLGARFVRLDGTEIVSLFILSVASLLGANKTLDRE